MRLPLTSKKSFKLDHAFDDHVYGDHPYKSGDDLSISTITGGSEPPAYADDPISKVFESPLEKKMRKRSHWVAYATTFVMTVGFSVVVTGVWPYLQALYPGVPLSKTWLGWVIAANPLGQLIASPLVGYLGNRLGSIRIICYCTMTLFILGNLFYSFLTLTSDWFVNSACYMMVLSRFIVGLSSSNVTLCRSYLASSTTVKERTTGITIVSAAQATGYVVGPAIQTVISLIIDDPLLKYRACGWVAAALGVINFFLLTPFVFTEYNIAEKERNLLQSRLQEDGKEFVLPTPDYGGVFSVMFAFFMNQFIYVLIETLFEAFVSDQYAWCDNLAVIIVGISLSIGGVLSIAMFITATRLAKKYEERKILIFLAFIPISIGVLLFQPIGSAKLIYCSGDTYNLTTFSPSSTMSTEKAIFAMDSVWRSDADPVAIDAIQSRNLLGIDSIENRQLLKMDSIENSQLVKMDSIENRQLLKMDSIENRQLLKMDSIENRQIVEIDSIEKHQLVDIDSIHTRQLLDIDDPYNHNKDEGNFCENDDCYGCPLEQSWCDGYTQLNIIQFYVAFLVVILGYPYGVSMSNAIMSKMLGPNPQGLWMGILTSCGSLARVCGPIFVSQVYTKSGTRWTFGILLAGMLVALAELTIMFKRLVPMKIPALQEVGKV